MQRTDYGPIRGGSSTDGGTAYFAGEDTGFSEDGVAIGAGSGNDRQNRLCSDGAPCVRDDGV